MRYNLLILMLELCSLYNHSHMMHMSFLALRCIYIQLLKLTGEHELSLSVIIVLMRAALAV